MLNPPWKLWWKFPTTQRDRENILLPREAFNFLLRVQAPRLLRRINFRGESFDLATTVGWIRVVRNLNRSSLSEVKNELPSQRFSDRSLSRVTAPLPCLSFRWIRSTGVPGWMVISDGGAYKPEIFFFFFFPPDALGIVANNIDDWMADQRRRAIFIYEAGWIPPFKISLTTNHIWTENCSFALQIRSIRLSKWKIETSAGVWGIGLDEFENRNEIRWKLLQK